MRRAGRVGRMGVRRIQCFCRGTRRKRQFGRPNSRCKDNMGRNEIGWWFLDWIDVAQNKNEWRGVSEHSGD